MNISSASSVRSLATVSVSPRNSSMVRLALFSSPSVTLDSSPSRVEVLVVLEPLISMVTSGVSELFSQASWLPSPSFLTLSDSLQWGIFNMSRCL